MKINENDEKLLVQYLDGTLTGDEIKQTESRINESEILRTRFNELKITDSITRKVIKLESPSKNFTAKVLQNLDNYRPTQLSVSRNGILLLIGILVAIGITSLLLSYGSYDVLEGNFALQSLNSSKNFKLPNIHFPGKLIINLLLILTTAISFFVLDKTILRPLFSRRGDLGR